MAKPTVKRRRKAAESAAFDFAEYLFLLERVLPGRSKARRLLPQLENHVDTLKILARRSWEMVDVTNGTARDQATTDLESMMKIPSGWIYEIAVKPAMDASSLKEAPEGVIEEVQTLPQARAKLLLHRSVHHGSPQR